MSIFTKEDYTTLMIDLSDGELLASTTCIDAKYFGMLNISSFYPFSDYSVGALLMLYPHLSENQEKLRLQLEFWMECDNNKLYDKCYWIAVDRENKVYMRQVHD